MTNPEPAISRDTTSDRVAAHLRARILDGQLGAGDKLPPERALAWELGVNRVTLRSALAALAAEKLVAIRQGSGATIADFLAVGGPTLIPAWIALAKGPKARAAIGDLLAVRRALTRVVLERVIAHLDARTHARLTDALVRFTAAVAHVDTARASSVDTGADTGADKGADKGADTASIAKADLEMARALVREAHSPVLALVINPIAHVLSSLPELRAAIYREPHKNVLGWSALVDALAGPIGDPHAAISSILDVQRAHDDATLAHLNTGRRK